MQPNVDPKIHMPCEVCLDKETLQGLLFGGAAAAATTTDTTMKKENIVGINQSKHF
eukprot:m.96169 g.96169  ORF g.96169 m.96169 type:complete len:56 (+) comp26871_c0_seq2:2564-2731(+)